MLISNTSSSPVYSSDYTKQFVQQTKEADEVSQEQIVASTSNSAAKNHSAKKSTSTSTSPYQTMDEFMEEMVKRLSENDQDAYKIAKKLKEEQEKNQKEQNSFYSSKKSSKKNSFSIHVNYSSSSMLQKLAFSKTRGGVHGVINTVRQNIRAVKSSSSSTSEIQSTVRRLKRVIQFAEKKLTALRHEERLQIQKETARIAENHREEIKAMKEAQRRKRIRKAYEHCNTIDSEEMMHHAKNEYYESMMNHQDSSIPSTIPSAVPDAASIASSMTAISAASTSFVQSAELISAAGVTSSISLDILA